MTFATGHTARPRTGFVGGAAAPARAGLWIGGLTLTGVICAAFSGWEPYLLITGVVVMTPLIGFVNLHASETRRRDATLKLAQDEVAGAGCPTRALRCCC